MSLEMKITEELIARQPPEAQAIIRVLLAKIQELEERFNKTPQNSSLPPSTQHPHAKPPPARRSPGKSAVDNQGTLSTSEHSCRPNSVTMSSR